MSTPEPSGMSRRQVLRTGTIGAASAAFLAACTHARKKHPAPPGTSGSPVETTLVAPTVPTTQPSAVALDDDITLWRTGTSLELVAAAAYRNIGTKLTDDGWRTIASRWADDHEANAKVFRDATEPAKKKVDDPNKYVQEHDIDPILDDLSTDAAILDFFHDLESTLTATYVTAAGTFTAADWRQQVMTFGSASARRVGVLANGGDGAIADAATYPLADLISNDAYVLSTPKKADAGS